MNNRHFLGSIYLFKYKNYIQWRHLALQKVAINSIKLQQL
jgi:hypothetical protein